MTLQYRKSDLDAAATQLELVATGLATAATAASTPVAPAGADEISLANSGRLTSHGHKIATHLVDGGRRLLEGATYLRTIGAAYEAEDNPSSSGIPSAAAQAAPATINFPSLPAPAVTVDLPAAPVWVARDAQANSTLINTGPGTGAATTAQAAWQPVNAAVRSARTGLQSAKTSLTAWSGPNSTAANTVLGQYEKWLDSTGTAVSTHVTNIGNYGGNYRQAVTSTPTVQYVTDIKARLLQAIQQNTAVPGSRTAEIAQLQTALEQANQAARTSYTSYAGASPSLPGDPAGPPTLTNGTAAPTPTPGNGMSDLPPELAAIAAKDPALAKAIAEARGKTQDPEEVMKIAEQLLQAGTGAAGGILQGFSQALQGVGQQVSQLGSTASQGVGQLAQKVLGSQQDTKTTGGDDPSLDPFAGIDPTGGGGTGGGAGGGGFGGLGDVTAPASASGPVSSPNLGVNPNGAAPAVTPAATTSSAATSSRTPMVPPMIPPVAPGAGANGGGGAGTEKLIGPQRTLDETRRAVEPVKGGRTAADRRPELTPPANTPRSRRRRTTTPATEGES